ncbi:MAG: hypothetical protein JW828_12705 [Sedimentisphaerales bacterium]|nr:hypothetical protein [Sedimentisphaerales bacterium]
MVLHFSWRLGSSYRISNRMKRLKFLNLQVLLAFLGLYGLFITSLVTVAVWKNPIHRAVLLMAWGLILFWCILGGLISMLLRHRIRVFVNKIPLGWRFKFVLFCTLMALLEEAVTVTMTNCAPLFGVKVGQAYITASANYLDVVCLHSVVVFVAMFVCWAWMLGRRNFKPLQVMLLFGLTGTLAEMSFTGLQALAQVGFWVFVYGLMVYLPAFCIPQDRHAKPVRWWNWPIALILPFVFVIPVACLIHWIHPVKIHFPPITGG